VCNLYSHTTHTGHTMEIKEKRLNVRADAHLIDAFVAAAAGQDRTASQLIRDYMREYVKKNGQTDLFKQK
jgi:predicted HicB family RNase H-like nuclease